MEEKKKKNLFCVPLIGSEIPEELSKRYWIQTEAQVNRLEGSFGPVNKLYHEADYLGGEAGIKNLQRMNAKSYQFIKKRVDEGGELLVLEDKETFLQIVDCQLFLALRFSSKEVLEKISKLRQEIFKLYEKALQKRREFIARQISETLGEGETGILLMRDEERMKIQFPSEINVILVRPLVLSEIERWQREEKGTP